MSKLLRGWRQAAAAAVVLSLLISAFATWLDWSANPDGLFRSGAVTHLPVVIETLTSWILPALMITIPLSVVIVVLVNTLLINAGRKADRKNRHVATKDASAS